MTEVCKHCGAVDECWGSYFDPDGFGTAGHGPGDVWRIVCQVCGGFQDTPKKRNRKVKSENGVR